MATAFMSLNASTLINHAVPLRASATDAEEFHSSIFNSNCQNSFLKRGNRINLISPRRDGADYLKTTLVVGNISLIVIAFIQSNN